LNWRVNVHERAEAELRRLPGHIIKRVAAKLIDLQANPFPGGSKKLQGHTGFRLRVGDYRILYEADVARRVVTVYAIGHRKDIYK
jgi:mRNA interferase RelE/StbE